MEYCEVKFYRHASRFDKCEEPYNYVEYSSSLADLDTGEETILVFGNPNGFEACLAETMQVLDRMDSEFINDRDN